MMHNDRSKKLRRIVFLTGKDLDRVKQDVRKTKCAISNVHLRVAKHLALVKPDPLFL